jgi:hypothetical protein
VATRNGFENLGSVSVAWVTVLCCLSIFRKQCIGNFRVMRPEIASDIETRSSNFGIKTIFSVGQYNHMVINHVNHKMHTILYKTINHSCV